MQKDAPLILVLKVCMNKLLIVIIVLLISSPSWAEGFIGKWAVTKVDMPENYFGEIKYPKYFELTEKEGKIFGSYKDQYDYECDFILSALINDGNELLLMNCGTTKHDSSWAPLHKVKLIEGRLVGSVITNTQRFVWYAEPTGSLPLTRSSN